MKKKKMMSAEPELVHTDASPDMNPNDIMNNETNARIQATLESPEREDGSMEALETDPNNMGMTPDEKKRMARLRSYIDTLDFTSSK